MVDEEKIDFLERLQLEIKEIVDVVEEYIEVASMDDLEDQDLLEEARKQVSDKKDEIYALRTEVNIVDSEIDENIDNILVEIQDLEEIIDEILNVNNPIDYKDDLYNKLDLIEKTIKDFHDGVQV